ncbi:MAG TPA: outer membrane protein assembly factor BamE [Caulobacteraceae bacterium]|nr:outer membrane protein assembly factor BamE [Caulobacteraceae bacterium]
MQRSTAPFLCALIASAALIGACTPTTDFQGFQAIDAKPQDLQAGIDTKQSVRTKLGTPSAVSTFDPDVWFYISQVTETQAFYQPKMIRRDVVAVSFNKGGDTVAKIDTLSLKDGRVIAYDGRETPTRGRQLTAIEQLIGEIGSGSLATPTDVTPGTRPGQ